MMTYEPKFANPDARVRGGRSTARKCNRFDMQVAYRRWRELLNEMYGETS